MSQPSIYFVGTQQEVSHHAAPLQRSLDVKIAEPKEVVENAKSGDLAIFYSEHFDRFRDACQQLKQRNVATLYMVDGILEWRNAWENMPNEVACPYAMRPVLSHKVACIGQSQARVLNAWGNESKTEVVGIPRLEGMGRESVERSNSTASFRVLVMTAKTPGFTPEQVDRVRESLKDLKNWQAANGQSNQTNLNVEFVWRLTGGLAEEIGVETQVNDLTGKELAAVLANVDAVISTPSTAMLEAMQMGLPVAVLDYHNCPHYVNAGWDICSNEHIGPTIVQMAERNEVRMLFQQNELADALNINGNSLQRFVELIEKMLASAGRQLESDDSQPLSFNEPLLTPLPQTLATFSHEALYPTADEFTSEDRTVLQVELSHARREIAHLHRELAQIQSELDQAHQIFEQIEKHPIAGPVVRIRQKMLDLMATMRNRKNKLDSTHPITQSRSNPETPSN
jgi:hypothetical protein